MAGVRCANAGDAATLSPHSLSVASPSVSLTAPRFHPTPSSTTAPIGELNCLDNRSPSFLPALAALTARCTATLLAFAPPSSVARIASERRASACDQTMRAEA